MSNPLPRLGRYELVRKIAAGGMAEIFLARQWGAGGFFRDVVIKRLFKHLAEHTRQLRMFQDEGRLLAQLSHPNIPQVYDVGFADGYWYIAMEFVDGHTVTDVWRQGAKMGVVMPVPVALGVVMQICEALHHAHERTDRAHRPLRIVHRDVTPQNVMLTRDGVAKLMDFGVAQTSARKDTEAGAVRGTFSYMAPEQVRAKPLDKRADVFAVGVILYELTTGTRLFRGSDVQIMTQVVEEDVPPPSSRVPDYPPDLEEITMGALQRDRARRIPSTAHLAWKLEELAMRTGMLVGPRAVARYVTQVIPAETVKEEALGIVEPNRLELVADVSEEMDSELPPPVDDEGMLDDLDLLSLPPEGDPSDIPDPFSFPSDAEQLGEPSFVADLMDEHGTLRPPVSEAQRHPGLDPSLVLEAFEDDPGRASRPVVLLAQPKKKSLPPDYVTELERRLAEEEEALDVSDEMIPVELPEEDREP